MEGGYTALHAGTRRSYCMREHKPAALHRVPLGRRPPHPSELAGAMAVNEEEADGRWPRTFEALRFSTIVGQEPSHLDQTEYQSTSVYNTFEDMLRAQGL